MRKILPLVPIVLTLFSRAPAATPETRPGIVILSIRQGSTGEQAGFQTGDVVLTWRRKEASGAEIRGELSSAFDWTSLMLEQVPRGRVDLQGFRGQEEKTWILPGGAPAALEDIQIRPLLPDDLLTFFERGSERMAVKDVDAALALWQAAQNTAYAHKEESLSRWFLLHAARELVKAGRAAEGDPLYQRLTIAFEAENTGATAAAQLSREWAENLRERKLWARAEAADRHALGLDRQASPDSLAASWSLTGLGYTASLSAGAQDAEVFFREALAIRERLAPGCVEIATSWWDRGNDAQINKEYRTARARYRQAVALAERVTPNSRYLAERLASLGRAEYYLGDLNAARKIWQRALAIAEKQAPDDRVTAGLLQGLSDIELIRQNWPEARELLRRSLALSSRLAIDPFAYADILADLALAERRLGREAESAAHYCQALDIFEEQRQQFATNPEVHLRWEAAFSDYYRDCAQALVEVGKPERAFDVLERGRARTFLNLMAEGSQRPAGLEGDPAAEWRGLDVEYDRIQKNLIDLKVRMEVNPQAIHNREGRLREIQREKREILSESRLDARPQYPPPLDFATAARVLDPGTILLSYVSTEDQTLLFVVKPEPDGKPRLAVFYIPVGRKALEEKVQAFRSTLIEDRFHGRQLKRQGGALYDILFRPAEASLADGRRLLIIPDGPLHTLPFAALWRNGHFLAEDQPLHFAISVSAYAELQKRRRAGIDPDSGMLVAFADPLGHKTSANNKAYQEKDPALRGALRHGFSPLPASRHEVIGIARLFPRSRVFWGREATEERAKEEAGNATFLHFAVHALLNERMPANSALVLSPPPPNGKEQGNGLLQSWEIVEDLHLDADLVTLSACDTALGPDMGGEGLIGLTRAFQSAGARSVLATLWGISDRPSASLMVSFYTSLREGKSKDEALREAQIQQIRSKTATEPFYWAGYQLYGDWR